MSFNVRVFGYRGVRNIPRVSQQQFSGDSVDVLDEPYLWRQLLVVNGTVPPAFTIQLPDKSTLLRIEVPDNSAVRFEINPPGRNVAADGSSPRLVGDNNFGWGEGFALSLVDAASFA